MPYSHDLVPGDPSLFQSASPGILGLLLYLHLQNPGAETNMSVGRRLLHTGRSGLPLQLCWVDQSPVTYTPTRVTHLPEKVLCSPKQSCLENDDGALSNALRGANQPLSRVQTHCASHLRPAVKCGAATPGCWFHFHLNMMLDIR